MPDPIPGEAVRLALAARAHALIDRPTPTALSDEALTRQMLEAARPVLAVAERNRLAAGTSCITPCDDDCELQPDGCHELHQVPRKQTHNPVFCEDIRAAIAAAREAERERCAQLAGDLKFTLYRPGNGPGAGEQSLNVVPLAELLAALRQGAASGHPPDTTGPATH